MAIQQDIQFFSGNDIVLELTVTDESTGLPIDLTGAQSIIWALSKTARGDPVIEYSLGAGVAIVNAATGRVDITIASADVEPISGTYYHEIRLTNIAGNKTTLTYGIVTISVNLIRT